MQSIMTSSDKEEENCVICLETLSCDQTSLPCQHVMCTSCVETLINKQLKKRSETDAYLICPTCRYEVWEPNDIPYYCFITSNAPTLSILKKIEPVINLRYGGKKGKLLVHNYFLENDAHSSIKKAIQFHRMDIFQWWMEKIEFEMSHYKMREYCLLAIKHNNLMALQLLLDLKENTEILNTLCEDFFVRFDKEFHFRDVSLEIFEFFYSKSIIVWKRHYDIQIALHQVESIEKLNWWAERLPLYHFDDVFFSQKIEILEWWKLHDPDAFRHADVATIIDQISMLDVLDWWKHNLKAENMKFDYTKEAIHGALHNDNIDMLEWWTTNNFPLKMNAQVCFRLAHSKKALDWCVKYIPNVYDLLPYILSEIIERNCKGFDGDDNNNYTFADEERSTVMTWCLDQCNLMAATTAHSAQSPFNACASKCIDQLAGWGFIEQLQWWKEQDFLFAFTEDAIDIASANGHLNILEWWQENGLPFEYSRYALTEAIKVGHEYVIEWWKTSGLKLKIDFTDQDLKENYKNMGIEYLFNSGQCTQILKRKRYSN